LGQTNYATTSANARIVIAAAPTALIGTAKKRNPLPTALFAAELHQNALAVLFTAASDQGKYYWLLERQPLSAPAMLFRDWLIAAAEQHDTPPQ
jgi:hypothetical protein